MGLKSHHLWQKPNLPWNPKWARSGTSRESMTPLRWWIKSQSASSLIIQCIRKSQSNLRTRSWLMNKTIIKSLELSSTVRLILLLLLISPETKRNLWVRPSKVCFRPHQMLSPMMPPCAPVMARQGSMKVMASSMVSNTWTMESRMICKNNRSI